MELLELARNFGLPLALLIVAVVVLWRAWRLERQVREKELDARAARLMVREEELYTLYRELALRDLNKLVRKRLLKHGNQDEQSKDIPG